MNLESVALDSGSISNGESFIKAVLSKDDNNFTALYGNSLIFYKQGRIAESAESLNRALEIDLLASQFQVNKLKEMIIELLMPKPPVKLIVLDELKKRYDDIKQVSYLFNFMTVLNPQIFILPSNSDTLQKFKTLQKRPSSQVGILKTVNKNNFCIICNKAFAKKFSLNRHMYLHNGIRNHSCRCVN